MNLSLTQAYIQTLTGSLDTICDFRVIHDSNKGEMGRNIRGTLLQVYKELVSYNQAGWGVFMCVNAMDGQGYTLQNVAYIRSQIADLDDVFTSESSYQTAARSNMPPHFAVQSSPNKYHLYWLVEPYTGNDFFTNQQRKINQLYNGDKSIIDATRVLRVPGFMHCKGEPKLVTCHAIHNGARYSAQYVESALAHVNVFEHINTRSPLGTEALKAPSIEWLNQALYLLNPNNLGREEWLSISAAYKQAGWTLASDEQLFQNWQTWCAHYAGNDEAENRKLWNSIKDTEVGWASFERRTPINIYMAHSQPTQATVQPPQLSMPSTNSPTLTVPPARQVKDKFGELLSPAECEEYFKGCYFVSRMGEIFTPDGRFMNSTQFNGTYGGKQFILGNMNAKATDEPWKAALRSTAWQIPKVDHVRFLPDRAELEIIDDELGRKGLNTYKKPKIQSKQGDVSLWLRHIENILPVESDRQIFFSYLAHCVKYPGHKVPWSIMLQSVEGIGKGIFSELMGRALGSMYTYVPKAEELIASGSKFNGWMRSRLMIIVNEIKIDERRELIEILKPMITDPRIEVQSKGVDQEMEDNVSNWLFFSNYKDAIPITKNGRRYCIFYSKLQSLRDLHSAGMDDYYFNRLWNWLKEDNGFEYITDWLLNYPVSKGALPVRAPKTSCYEEALRISRSPLEVLIDEKIQMKEAGFRNGFVSVTMLHKAIANTRMKQPSELTIQTILESRDYYQIGYTSEPVLNEDLTRPSLIYSKDVMASPDDYKQ